MIKESLKQIAQAYVGSSTEDNSHFIISNTDTLEVYSIISSVVFPGDIIQHARNVSSRVGNVTLESKLGLIAQFRNGVQVA